MNKKIIIPFLIFVFLTLNVFASSLAVEGQKFAAYLTIIAIMVSLPAFISLYLHMKKTNLGHVLFQPFLAMFIGFIGIMLNSIIDILRVFQGFTVDNFSIVMGINRAFSSVLIAVGCVLMFFGMRKRGLFSFSYYNHQKTQNNLDSTESKKKSNLKTKVKAKTKVRSKTKPKVKSKIKARAKFKSKA